MVRHIMADGREITDADLKGHVVPVNEKTRAAYQLLAKKEEAQCLRELRQS